MNKLVLLHYKSALEILEKQTEKQPSSPLGYTKGKVGERSQVL